MIYCLLHLYGEKETLLYESDFVIHYRLQRTIEMYKEMFLKYMNSFQNKKIDSWIYYLDSALLAYENLERMKLSRIFSYSTMYSLQNYVIPIPDYLSFWSRKQSNFEQVSPEKFKMVALNGWTDRRAFWRGNVYNQRDRRILQILGEQFPKELKIESSTSGVNIPMEEMARYKYLIDVRGSGWTDRVKILLQLGRPLLLVDRPDREWYFDQLVPMKHYVPVKEDFSDLIEKIRYLEEHPQLYDEIVKNALEFSEKVLNAKVLEYLRDVTLKYGVVDELDDRKWPWNPETYRKGKLLE